MPGLGWATAIHSFTKHFLGTTYSLRAGRVRGTEITTRGRLLTRGCQQGKINMKIQCRAYKAGLRGAACKRALGPQHRAVPAAGGFTVSACLGGGCQLPGKALGLGAPGTSRMWPCSHGAHRLARRQSRSREVQCRVRGCWLGGTEIWHDTHISLRQT